MPLKFFFLILANIKFVPVVCQIDLGSLSLGQNKHGDLEVGFNQAANIFGFGGDRGLDFTIGEGRFGTKARQGALIGGERVGVDSGFGINEAEGLNLGSVLNFGNNPTPSTNPAGQFLSFLERIGKFFTGLGKPSDATTTILPQNAKPSDKAKSIFDNFGVSKKETFGGSMKHAQTEDANYDDYYHNVGAEDEAGQGQLNTTSSSSLSHEQLVGMSRNTGIELNTTTI